MKVNTLDRFIELAYKGGTLLQIDAPGKFMFTIYKYFQKEAIKYQYTTWIRIDEDTLTEKIGTFIRFLWFELDY